MFFYLDNAGAFPIEQKITDMQVSWMQVQGSK